MPIYEYKCKKCNTVFEKLESINNSEKSAECPICNEEAIRIISDSNFHLKGSGFHNTDYKKKEVCPSSNSCCNSCPHS